MNAPLAIVACSICGEASRLLYRDLYDDRYGYPGEFALYVCDSCGHRHIPVAFGSEELTSLYTNYYPRGGFDLDSFRPEREESGFLSWLNGDRGSAFRWVPRNVRVLDIGCGIGSTLAYHAARGCQAVGMEADGNVQAIARRYGLDIRQGVFDGNQFASESFDYVTLDQVAEHVVDPHALLRGVARVLRPGGTVVITTPNAGSFGAHLFGRKWLNWHVPYHIQFYTPRSLKHAARRAGLEVVRARTVTASEWQYYQWMHVLQYPPRGEPSGFWSAKGRVRHVSPFLDRSVSQGRRLRLHRYISRLLDVLGLGDNFVFILRKA